VERLRYIDESSRKLLIEAADFIESAQVARSESMTDFQDLLRQVKERIGVGNSMTIYGIARADTEPPQIEAKENAQSDANTSESAKPPPTE
jgi:DNA-binding protein H-NS